MEHNKKIRSSAMLAKMALMLVLSCSMGGKGHATGQIADILLRNGDTLLLFSNPLEQYFDDNHPRPNHLFGYGSTACWRGYQAYFELRGDSLFLQKLIVSYDEDTLDDLSKVIAGAPTKGPVFAHWVTQTLCAPRGRLLYYVHMGYGSLYEYEDLLEFENGILKEEKMADNSPTFTPFRDGIGPELLQEYFARYLALDPKQYPKNKGIGIRVSEVDCDGKVLEAEVVSADSIFPNQVVQSTIEALKSLPRFDIEYRHGKPLQHIGIELTIEPTNRMNSEMEDYVQSLLRDMADGRDSSSVLRSIIWEYERIIEKCMIYLEDSESAAVYDDYYLKIFNGDSSLLPVKQIEKASAELLAYYYMLWDLTDDRLELYKDIVKAEQNAGSSHNPKVVAIDGPPFEYLISEEDLTPTPEKTNPYYLNCRRTLVSNELRAFGEGAVHDALPEDVVESYRYLSVERGVMSYTAPLLIKVTFDGRQARLSWRKAAEKIDEYYERDHHRHSIKAQGERMLTKKEWNALKMKAKKLNLDHMKLSDEFSPSQGKVIHVEHKTQQGYRVLDSDLWSDNTSHKSSLQLWEFCQMLEELMEE